MADRTEFLRRLLDESGGDVVDSTPELLARPRPESPPTTPRGASYLVQQHWDDELPPQLRNSAPGFATVGSRLLAGLRLRSLRGAAGRQNALRAMRLLLFALAVVGGLAGVGVAWIHATTDPLADVRAYYDAAARLNAGQPLYPVTANPDAADVYRYPPLLAIVLRPFAAVLTYDTFALVWETVVVLGSLALLVRYLGPRAPRTWLAIGILGVAIGWAVAIGQAQVPLTLLVALGQPWSIALAANLKLFPALIILWWLGRRDYQAAMAFALWCVVLGLVQLALDSTGVLAFVNSVGLTEVGAVRNVSPYAASPVLWAGLLLFGVVVTYAIARTRWGWAAAVALSTLAPPRLLIYALTTLLATLRQPEASREPG